MSDNTPNTEQHMFVRVFDFTGKTELNQRAQDVAVIWDDLDLGAQVGIPLSTTFIEDRLFLQDADSSVRDDLGAIRHSIMGLTETPDSLRMIIGLWGRFCRLGSPAIGMKSSSRTTPSELEKYVIKTLVSGW